jgi:Molybdopterin oxidoreductase
MTRKQSIHPYGGPAGGWGALLETEEALAEQHILIKGSRSLLSMNQPRGFKCPSCAWPDPSAPFPVKFCENGAKALAWEATSKRVTREFFAGNTVSWLEQQSDYWLEEQGRLTEPMVYHEPSDRYVPISWDQAFALIGRRLNQLQSPDQAEFYTSGKASNEAAFLYQLFVREFGTNNLPDCSNMCHEATSVGLPPALGVGKATVILDDFNHADAIFIFGQNPGTNSPRMLNDLHAAARRGGQIVTFNPLKERALERFADPKNVIEMATFSSTPISINRSHVVHGREALVLLCIARSATCRQRGRSSSRSRTQPAWSKLRRVKTSRQALFFSQSQRLSRGSLAQHCQTREIFGQRRDLFLSREEKKKSERFFPMRLSTLERSPPIIPSASRAGSRWCPMICLRAPVPLITPRPTASFRSTAGMSRAARRPLSRSRCESSRVRLQARMWRLPVTNNIS